MGMAIQLEGEIEIWVRVIDVKKFFLDLTVPFHI